MTGMCSLVFCNDRDIFCAGRVVDEDLRRTMKACGGAIQTSVNGLAEGVLGTCELFQEEQIGGERSVLQLDPLGRAVCVGTQELA